MKIAFLDTNIFLRQLLADEPTQSPQATAYFEHIKARELTARTSDIVVFEVVFTLERGYRRSKAEIRSHLLPLLELPGIILPGKRKFRQVFDTYVERNISFADAYHAVLMQQLKLTEIVSFDRDFNRIPGITRIEP